MRKKEVEALRTDLKKMFDIQRSNGSTVFALQFTIDEQRNKIQYLTDRIKDLEESFSKLVKLEYPESTEQQKEFFRWSKAND